MRLSHVSADAASMQLKIDLLYMYFIVVRCQMGSDESNVDINVEQYLCAAIKDGSNLSLFCEILT